VRSIKTAGAAVLIQALHIFSLKIGKLVEIESHTVNKYKEIIGIL
jgi:hypothetical protein